jgi:hypothetical protein
MTSLFSRAIDYPVESQFRRDPSGGLVLPLGPRKNGSFVDAKPEEERKRGRKDQIVPQAVAECFGADKPAGMRKRLPCRFRVTCCRIPLRSKLEVVAGTSSFLFRCLVHSYLCLAGYTKKHGSWLEFLKDRGSPIEVRPWTAKISRVKSLLDPGI